MIFSTTRFFSTTMAEIAIWTVYGSTVWEVYGPTVWPVYGECAMVTLPEKKSLLKKSRRLLKKVISEYECRLRNKDL